MAICICFFILLNICYLPLKLAEIFHKNHEKKSLSEIFVLCDFKNQQELKILKISKLDGCQVELFLVICLKTILQPPV